MDKIQWQQYMQYQNERRLNKQKKQSACIIFTAILTVSLLIQNFIYFAYFLRNDFVFPIFGSIPFALVVVISIVVLAATLASVIFLYHKVYFLQYFDFFCGSFISGCLSFVLFWVRMFIILCFLDMHEWTAFGYLFILFFSAPIVTPVALIFTDLFIAVYMAIRKKR